MGMPRELASIYFAVISVTAPIGGVFLGGILVTKFGGYNTSKAQKLMCYMGVLAVVTALPIPFVYN